MFFQSFISQASSEGNAQMFSEEIDLLRKYKKSKLNVRLIIPLPCPIEIDGNVSIFNLGGQKSQQGPQNTIHCPSKTSKFYVSDPSSQALA